MQCGRWKMFLPASRTAKSILSARAWNLRITNQSWALSNGLRLKRNINRRSRRGAVAGLVGIKSGVGVGAPSGDHAMESPTTKLALPHSGTETNAQLFEDWFDPIESGGCG